MKVKADLEEKYSKYLEINSGDEYSKACVDAGDAIGVALDEGKTAKEALEAMKGRDLTGYMAAMAVKGVAHFHPRGDEVRKEWNKDWGAPETQKGLVNPAVLNIGDDGKMSPEIERV